MRLGLSISMAAHGLVLGWGMVSFSGVEPLHPDPIKLLPVDLVTVATVTELEKGDQISAILDEAEAERPKKEKTKPIIDDKVATAPVIGKKAKVPPDRSPSIEELLKDEKQVSKPAKPAPAIDPQAELIKLLATQPRKKPTSPAKPDPVQKRTDQTQKTAKAKQPSGFNAVEIASLLSKGSTKSASSEQNAKVGVTDGVEEAKMTQSEVDYFRARLAQCWRPPAGAPNAEALQVVMIIYLDKSGILSNPPQIQNPSSERFHQAAAESAVRAVYECAPYDFLPAEKHIQWKAIKMTFDPKEMLGG